MFSRDPILCDVEHVTTDPVPEWLNQIAQSLNTQGAIRASSVELTEAGTGFYRVTVEAVDPFELFQELAAWDVTWSLAVDFVDERDRVVSLTIGHANE